MIYFKRWTGAISLVSVLVDRESYCKELSLFFQSGIFTSLKRKRYWRVHEIAVFITSASIVCAYAQNSQESRCSHAEIMVVDEGSDQRLDN